MHTKFKNAKSKFASHTCIQRFIKFKILIKLMKNEGQYCRIEYKRCEKAHFPIFSLDKIQLNKLQTLLHELRKRRKNYIQRNKWD